MPRDGSGIYHRPVGTDAVSDTTIESTKYNSNVADVETDLNTPRPIAAGGTGASSALDARDNLDAEAAMQSVTNYDMQIWESGSFWSDVGATSAPNLTDMFSGIVWVTNNDQRFVTLEARNVTTGEKWIRRKVSNVWGAWSSDTDNYVNATGDTMTGTLTVALNGLPSLILNRLGGPTDGRAVIGQSNGLNRWRVELGNNTNEASSNTGSDFAIYSYTDAGTLFQGPLTITRWNGLVNINNGAVVAGGLKSYADLSVENSAPRIFLNSSLVSSGAYIESQMFSAKRWQLFLGDGSAESTGNAGSNFALYRCNDAGVQMGPVLTSDRATGTVQTVNNHVINGTTRMIGTVQVGNTAMPALGTQIKVAFAGGGVSYGLSFRPTADVTQTIYMENAAGAFIGSISQNATNVAYNTTSDERLKEDLKSFDAGNIVDNTNVFDFKWKGTDQRSHGVIAQQAAQTYPQAITYVKEQDVWLVDYSKYVPVILQELKALRERVAALEELEANP